MPDSSEFESLLSKVFKGGVVLFFGLAFELAVSFVAKIIIAQYLGRVDYGAVSLGITTMSFVATLLLGGLRTGVGRMLPRYEDPKHRRGVLISGFQLGLSSAIIVGGAVVLFAPWIAQHVFQDPAVSPILRIFGAIIPLSGLLMYSISVIQGLQESVPKIYIENITLPLVRFAGVGVTVIFGLGSIGVAWAYFASYTSAALAGGYYLFTRSSLFSFDIEYKRKDWELLTFSAPLVVASVTSFVFAQIDILLLGALATTGDVGIYNVVYPIAQLLTVGLTAVGFVFMPVLSELHSKGEYQDMRQLYSTVSKWLFVGTFPLLLVMALFPRRVILLTFGAEYAPGAAALSILAIGFFSDAVAGPNRQTLTSIGNTRTLMFGSLLAAGLNVVLNVLLIPRYTYLGAAVATTVSYLAFNIYYSALLYQETGIQPLSRSLLIPGIIGSITVGSVYILTKTLFVVTVPILVVMFCVFVGVYGIAVLRFSIKSQEVMLVLRFEDQYGIDLGPLKRIGNWFIKQ